MHLFCHDRCWLETKCRQHTPPSPHSNRNSENHPLISKIHAYETAKSRTSEIYRSIPSLSSAANTCPAGGTHWVSTTPQELVPHTYEVHSEWRCDNHTRDENHVTHICQNNGHHSTPKIKSSTPQFKINKNLPSTNQPPKQQSATPKLTKNQQYGLSQ